MLTEPLSILYQQSCTPGATRGLEVSECDAQLQEGLKEGPGEPQACQSALGHGADPCDVPSDCAHRATRVQAQPGLA